MTMETNTHQYRSSPVHAEYCDRFNANGRLDSRGGSATAFLGLARRAEIALVAVMAVVTMLAIAAAVVVAAFRRRRLAVVVADGRAGSAAHRAADDGAVAAAHRLAHRRAGRAASAPPTMVEVSARAVETRPARLSEMMTSARFMRLTPEFEQMAQINRLVDSQLYRIVRDCSLLLVLHNFSNLYVAGRHEKWRSTPRRSAIFIRT